MNKKSSHPLVFVFLLWALALTLTTMGNGGTTLAYSPCEGDLDRDGDIDGSDLAVFAADFGRTDCATGPVCEGDFDNDGDVDGSDLAVFAADFGRTDCASGPPCEGDFDGDGDVDGSDLALFAADFGRTDCPTP